MYNLKETSLEWALLHLVRYPDSDQFPRLFEFEAIKHSWSKIKPHLLAIDLDEYVPGSSEVMLAFKPNGTYRVVHQLQPLDSLIYTALVHEIADQVEAFRIPRKRCIAFSYRIDLDANGAFFSNTKESYREWLERSEELADKFPKGYALVCDVVDFYNQIYLHRVNNVLAEAGAKSGPVIEKFLMRLNSNVSQGIPVGPYASIILAEAIMADVDKKLLSYTSSFTRYVDDIHIFFRRKAEAQVTLHELTRYLYENHRLVLSASKTRILETETFKQEFIVNQENIDKQLFHGKVENLKVGPYGDAESNSDEDVELEPGERFEVVSEMYKERFEEALGFEVLDLGVMRHIIRQAAHYKIRSMIPIMLDNFTWLLPVLPDVINYFRIVLTPQVAKRYQARFRRLLKNEYINLPFVNMWVYTLFQHEAFRGTSILIEYTRVHRIRERALVAKRQRDTTWLKDIKSGLDTLGPWDRRAVIFTSTILSKDEMKHWLSLEQRRADCLNSAVCSKAVADKNASDSKT